MTYEEALHQIHNTGRFPKTAGLSRIQKLLSLLGNPEKGLRCIHVAGTNGKGSVTTMAAAMLEEAGFRVGKYTSPYVVEFRERIQIDGEYIPKGRLAELVERLTPALEEMRAQGDPAAEFEFVTALAFQYFKEERCDAVVLEVGLGGRFDATNVIGRPLVCVITSIGLDHTAILGDTLEAVAGEKCGIIKEGCPVVCHPCQPPEALAVIMERCAETHSSLIRPNLSSVRDARFSPEGTSFSYGGRQWRLGLAGEYQLGNALTALEAVRALPPELAVSQDAMERGMARAFIPARFERIARDPLTILDGAHNPAGAAALARTLDALGCRELVGVTGVLREKDWQGVMEILSPYFRKLFAVTPAAGRALPAGELARWLQGRGVNAVPMDDAARALKEARRLAGPEGTVLAFGSLYLASDVRKLFFPGEE